jgi:glycosyltransferase involved in cell wall biosynthesis
MSARSTRPIVTECGLTHSAPSFRLLHAITSMDSVHGGPPEGIRQMSQSLIKQGHSIEVVCLDRAGRAPKIDSELKIHALGPAAGKYRYSRSLIPWLRANAVRYDCVIAHDIWQYPCLATWLALRDGATPYFVFTHGMLDPWFRRTYPLKHVKKAVYWRAAGHKILRDARAVFFTSEEERLLAGQSFRPYRCRGVTVGFGTTGAPGNAAHLRQAFLEAFPKLTGKKLLLYLGRIDPKKGLDLLIEAFARTVAKDHRFHLVIAGPANAEWKAALERHASRLSITTRMTWTGVLTNEQKWGAFHASDLFCLPSHQENFALVVAEALACGLPVLISSKVNIWREIVADGAGFVGTDDVTGTICGLKRWLLLTTDQQNDMRERARHCFDRHFKIDTAARKLVEAVRDQGVIVRSRNSEMANSARSTTAESFR